MRRNRRQPFHVQAKQIDLADIVIETAFIEGEMIHWQLGRVTAKGGDEEAGTVDIFINSYVDPPDTGWYQFHRDEWVWVIRTVRTENEGTRERPRL